MSCTKKSRFEIEQEFITFKADGIYHSLGKLVGNWNYEKGEVQFNLLGKTLNAILPNRLVGGHLCYVLKKPH